MEETEEEETPRKPDPHRWSWTIFVSVLVFGIAQWFKLCGSIFQDMSILLDRHDDYNRAQKEFQRRAALEIEALTGEVNAEAKKRRRRVRT